MLLLADSVIVHASLYAEAYVVLCKLSEGNIFLNSSIVVLQGS